MNKFLSLLKKNSGKLLLVATLASYGTSLYFTAKSVLKVNDIVMSSEGNKKEDKKKIVKAVAPSAISTAIGISCIIFSYINSEKKIAAVTAALVSTERYLHTYRKHLSDEQDHMITADMAQEKAEYIFDENKEYGPSELEPGETLYCESITGKLFVMKDVDMALAMKNINRNMQLKDAVTFNEWLDFLGLDHIDAGDMYGWSTWSDEFYGYKFIDFWLDDLEFKDGTPYKLITYPFMPHSDFECPDYYDDDLLNGTTIMESVVRL